MLIIRLFSILTISFYLALPIQALAGNGGPGGRYLRAPAVSWQDGRISGEVRNAPVQGLVEDLLRSGGYEWYVDGKLPGQISITFDGLTPAESVHKIMKQSDFNFAMIRAGAETTDGGVDMDIAQLTVYQPNGYVRFKRTAQKTTAVNSNSTRINPTVPLTRAAATKRSTQVKAPAAQPVRVAPKATRPEPPPKTELTPEELAKMDKELKAVLDEMLAAKQISEEEYRQLMEELE